MTQFLAKSDLSGLGRATVVWLRGDAPVIRGRVASEGASKIVVNWEDGTQTAVDKKHIRGTRATKPDDRDAIMEWLGSTREAAERFRNTAIGDVFSKALRDALEIARPERTKQAAEMTDQGRQMLDSDEWEGDGDGNYVLADAHYDLMYGPRQWYWVVMDGEANEELAGGTAESKREARQRSVDAYDRLVLRKADSAPPTENTEPEEVQSDDQGEQRDLAG